MSFSSKKRHSQQGYMMLTLMLFVALLAIAALGWIERADFQLKRDREEELIHRGVQYSRAIKRYVRKFGHYPARLEDLETTSGVRYLRRRYKDPVTGKDFKLLHQNDVQMSFSPGAASGLPPGAPGGAPGALNGNAAGTGGNGPSSGNPQNDDQQSTDNSSNGNSNGASGNSAQAPNGIASGQTIGGMPIIGVASISKDKTIREFNQKNHYYEWQFIYDPSTDRGGILTTPNQPSIQGATPINQMGGQQGGNPGQPGTNTGPAGPNMQPPTMPPTQQ
jgi:type II secretory pathway pseudopilin PulG